MSLTGSADVAATERHDKDAASAEAAREEVRARRRRALRTAAILALTALGFYVGFIYLSVSSSQ